MLRRIPGGLLIVLEGIDGAGKTTQAALIAQHFGEKGFAAVMSKEPTSGPWGQKLRESASSGRSTPQEELDLFLKDRAEHTANTLRPALEEGMIVILDRYYFSNAAYQGAKHPELSPEEIIAANEEFAPQPDLLVFIDTPVAEGLQRIRARGDEPNAFEEEAYLRQVREIFHDIDRPYKVTIDGTQDVRALAKEVLAIVREAAAAKLDDGGKTALGI